MPASTDGFAARILVVDDQQSNLRLLELALRRAGYAEVVSTTDPREVVALHERNRFDLILLDLQMPRMSGFEVMAGLPGVPILVLSADPTSLTQALEAGAAGFLAKPFVLAEVVLRVGALLEKIMARGERSARTSEPLRLEA
jgi:DNA-binding response OmpR family regulator